MSTHSSNYSQLHVAEPQQLPGMTCQDCDVTLGNSCGDDNDMAIDVGMSGTSSEGVEYGCRGCGRTVCEMCAVVAVGEGRECLQCKTSRKRWVGGIGWVPGSCI